MRRETAVEWFCLVAVCVMVGVMLAVIAAVLTGGGW